MFRDRAWRTTVPTASLIENMSSMMVAEQLTFNDYASHILAISNGALGQVRLIEALWIVHAPRYLGVGGLCNR